MSKYNTVMNPFKMLGFQISTLPCMKKTQDTPALASIDPRQALLDAARAIFVTEGVKGLSVRKVAESAGCTTMAVYSRMRGKDGILSALFDEGFELLANAQAAVDIRLKNEDRLLAICNAYRATANAYPHHYALMLGQHSGDLSPSAESQSKALATLEVLRDAVASMSSIKSQNHQASFAIANSLFALCHGWVSLQKIGFFDDSKKNQLAFKSAVLALLRIN